MTALRFEPSNFVTIAYITALHKYILWGLWIQLFSCPNSSEWVPRFSWDKHLEKNKSDCQHCHWEPIQPKSQFSTLISLSRSWLGVKLHTDSGADDGITEMKLHPGCQDTQAVTNVSKSYAIWLGVHGGGYAKPLRIHNPVIEREGPLGKWCFDTPSGSELDTCLCSHGDCHSFPWGEQKLLAEWLKTEPCLARDKRKKKRNGRLRISFMFTFISAYTKP